VVALKPQLAAASVPTLALPIQLCAIVADVAKPAVLAAPIYDEIPPPLPPPTGAQGPRAPPAANA
jgi:hypothetical protein